MSPESPTLALRLPGTWVQLDPSRPEVTLRRAREFARLAIGRADHLATERRHLRQATRRLVSGTAGSSDLQSAFVCHEVAPGVRMPMAVMVFVPWRVRISPVRGTGGADVGHGFLSAMREVEGEPASGWHTVGCVDGVAVRRWRIEDVELGAGEAGTAMPTFTAEYWRTVPGTKQVILVIATSPVVQIPRALVRLTDAVVAGSRVRRTTKAGPPEGDPASCLPEANA